MQDIPFTGATSPSPDERMLRINGIPLRYYQHGSGPDLVLLHGYTCTSEDWRPVAMRLADRYRILRFDFPNHGRSGDRQSVTMSDLVDCLDSVLGSLCEAPPILAGHSMGGMVALAYALEHRRQINWLVLADAYPHLASVVEVFGGAEDAADPYGYGSVIDRATPPAVIAQVRAEMAVGAARVGPELFSSLEAFDARSRLARISCPTLLLMGNRRWVTEVTLQDVVGRLGYAALPALTVALIDSHHFVMLEAPDAVAQAVAGFCAEHSAESASK